MFKNMNTTNSNIPNGFELLEDEPFVSGVGPVYARKNIDYLWDIGFIPLPRHANRFGVVHGGMLATLVDFSLGYNLMQMNPPDGLLSTVNLNIDYVAAAKLGKWIQARVMIEKSGGRLKFCSCSLYDEDNRLIVKATGVFSSAIKKR